MQSMIPLTANVEAFNKKLQAIDPASMGMTDYATRYLQHLLDNRMYYIAIYTQVLSNALLHSAKGMEEITLVDYGCGNGLLGLFAKFCGFKKVFLCDMNGDFLSASEKLSQELNIYIDQFICGDAKEMRTALEEETVDVVAGTDVIEHIYNLGHFFENIKMLNPNMITVFTTASNPANFYKVSRLKKIQVKDELEGCSPDDFLLAGAEKQEAFLNTRKQIISERFPGLSTDELITLGKNTRGLAKDDILKAAEIFLTKRQLPIPLSHPTNTCDPLTGSWTERILSIKEYKNLYSRFNFLLNIKNGFYNIHTASPRGEMNRILNLVVKILGRTAAPFIVLTGFPQR